MKVRLLAASVIVGALTFIAPSAANAACYGSQPVTIGTAGSIHYGGDNVTITASQASGAVGDWTLTLAITGETATGHGSSITHTFSTPVVPKVTVTTVTATFKYDDATACVASAPVGSASAATAAVYTVGAAAPAHSAAIQTSTTTAKVTLLPRGTTPTATTEPTVTPVKKGGTSIPNLGGPALGLLALGVALLGAGVWAVRRSRRSHA